MASRRGSSDAIDFVVIGSGIAGLRAALALAPAGRVVILTKADPTESNTGYAQGGIAAAVGDDDSPALHAEDTVRAGDGLCDEEAVRVLVENGPAGVRELVEWGTQFDREADGRLALGREAAHSVRRVLHAGDATGREIGRALWARASSTAAITTITHALVTDLLVDRGTVRGVRYFDADGRVREVAGRATLLATGGAGQVFRETTNPAVATGDGVALAYRAGARVADLEFVQFHPTALNVPGAPRFLISEAVRGEGARLINSHGEAFMTRYHPAGDLAPRDVVARSIVREAEATGGGVSLTLAHLDAAFVHRRFPTIAEACRDVGLDLARDPVPVGPAAHYIMGGVDTDVWGRTSLAGLFAAGEVACTGVHGANRLASNSLLEGLVFGARAGVAMQQPPQAAALGPRRVPAGKKGSGQFPDAGPGAQKWPEDPRKMALEEISRPLFVQDLVWRQVGLFRTRDGLQDAVRALDAAYLTARGRADATPADADAWRALNLATIARLIAGAALRREESRGAHFRQDFPARDDERWRVHVVDERPAVE